MATRSRMGQKDQIQGGDALDQLKGHEAPILTFHHETDAASDTGAYAYETCSDYRQPGDACDCVSEAVEGYSSRPAASGGPTD